MLWFLLFCCCIYLRPVPADLTTVSYMSQIFTLGVTPAVRYQLGEDCWHDTPKNIAAAIVRNGDYFDDCLQFSSGELSVSWMGDAICNGN